MRNVRFKIGTTVVIRSPLDSSAELGQIVAGPLDISGDIFFKVRTMDYCGATSQLSAERHRRWMTVTFFDGAGLRPSDQVSMSLLNVAGRELSFAVAVSFSGCCLSRSSSMSLSDVAAA